MASETSTTTDIAAVESAATVRVLVSALGELGESPWWRTKYLSETGLRFLERIYPRTAFAAGVRGCGIAARRVHDESIGRGKVFHLFRLPRSLENDIENDLTTGLGQRLLEELQGMLGDADRLRGRLLDLAQNSQKVKPGPWRLDEGDAAKPETYRRVAGAYAAAFERNERVFPFWEAPKE